MNSLAQDHKFGKAFLVFSGSNPRAVITFLRSLKKLKQKTVIIARSKQDLIFLSGFNSSVFAIREHDNLNLADITKCICEVRRKTGINEFVICPSSEFLNQFLLKHRVALKDLNCSLPVVNESTYKKLSDKYSSVKMVKEYGLDVPEELDFPEKFNQPIVAKPKANIDKTGRSRYPVLILNSDTFQMFKNRSDFREYFFQEFKTGDSFYLLAYISQSGDVCLASQKNLAQQADGKSIVLAESADFHLSKTAQQTIDMLKKEKFFGLVMIEYIECNDKYYFIEINPRLWGPMELLSLTNSPLINMFINDCLSPLVEKELLQIKTIQGKAKYLWLGGFVTNRKVGKTIQWKGIRGLRRYILLLSSLFSDVYFRLDSWKIFLFELTGIKLEKSKVTAIE